jgi:hypothetical protein
MDSANSLTLRSPKPLLKTENWTAVRIAANLLFVVTLATAGSRYVSATPDVLLLTAVLCAAWRMHLESGGRSWLWSALLATTGFFGFLLPLTNVSDSHPLQFLGGAVIVYGMTWSLAVFGTDEVLRPLANIAFLLGVAVFVPAAAVLSAVIISLTFLVVCRRKFEIGRVWDTALLIFTPVAFALLAIYGLRSLGVRDVPSPAISALAPSHYIFLPQMFSKIVRALYTTFVFFAAVQLLRLLKRETGRADLAVAIIATILVLAAGSSISTGVGLRDVSLILSASSAALLAALKAKKSDRIVADS